MNHLKRGFTLIELLVVIAIIGILSAVVLASLNSAREKGNIAAVKSNLNTIRIQAELYYNDAGAGYYHSTASTACNVGVWADATVAQAITAAQNAGQGSAGCNISTDRQKYAIQVQYKGPTNTGYFCVDSSGKASEKATIHVITDQACD